MVHFKNRLLFVVNLSTLVGLMIGLLIPVQSFFVEKSTVKSERVSSELFNYYWSHKLFKTVLLLLAPVL